MRPVFLLEVVINEIQLYLPRSTCSHISLSNNGKDSAIASTSNTRYGVKRIEHHRPPQLGRLAILQNRLAIHSKPTPHLLNYFTLYPYASPKMVKPKLGKTPVEEFTRSEEWSLPSD